MPDARLLFYSSNLNINDVLGNYSLTLIDALDTLAVSCQHTLVLFLRLCRDRTHIAPQGTVN